ncbi:MAG: AAA family ATPase [Bacillota bacterium]
MKVKFNYNHNLQQETSNHELVKKEPPNTHREKSNYKKWSGLTELKDGMTALSELHKLIGLSEVKKLVEELRAYVLVQKARAKEKLSNDSLVLHMVFSGNPGTGKTTIARILSKFFRELGILSKGHLVEVERADLVGEYIGHTAHKTKESLQKALGGILFVDEAYSLARGGDKDFGREAIDCLVKGMEDHKDNLILILAGYKIEMQKLIRTNPGLRSRFPIHIDFPDYSLDELMDIAKLMLSQREYYLSLEAELKMQNIIKTYVLSGQIQLGNARIIRNLIEKSIRQQALRLVTNNKLTREDLLMIKEDDICEEFKLYTDTRKIV